MKTLALFLAAAAFSATPASAARVLFSFTGNGQTGSGVFTTADPLSNGGTAVTGIEGLFNGRTITGLSGFAGADNLYFFGDPIKLSFGGVSFTDASNTSSNLYYSAARSSYRVFTAAPGAGQGGEQAFYEVSATFTELGAGAVPEPGVWALMLVGFGALGGALRRRRNRVAVA